MNGEHPAVAAFRASSPALSAGLVGLEAAASSDSPALVLGEPGTGRSTLARLLHGGGRRAAAPLVEMDPATSPASLFESELFGFRAGAFTGAERSQAGRVARAEGGTLILDHVEDLPLVAQPKLLRLLAERRYAPLGGVDTEAHVRFVAVGTADLEARVEQGIFRRDLFHRLEVLTFHLPPLRHRTVDLPHLLRRMLDDLGERFGRPDLRLSGSAEEWMRSYGWPGNLRQLRNVLERQMLFAPGPLLDPPPPADHATVEPETAPSLAAVERGAILAALAASRGHQGKAAAMLGISRKGLWEKRRRYGIP
ncbi:MAG: sigma-54-dependent transcriptional regulator [Thermoanaerobaculia bacterium]